MKLRNQSCQLILGHYTQQVGTKIPTYWNKISNLRGQKFQQVGIKFPTYGKNLNMPCVGICCLVSDAMYRGLLPCIGCQVPE